jgi:signal transduction histidine kinase
MTSGTHPLYQARPRSHHAPWWPALSPLIFWVASVVALNLILNLLHSEHRVFGLTPWKNYWAVLFDDLVMTTLSFFAGWSCHWRANQESDGIDASWRLLGWAFIAYGVAMSYVIVVSDNLALGAPWVQWRHLGFLFSFFLMIRGVMVWPVPRGIPTLRLQTTLDGLMVTATLFFIAWGLFLGELFESMPRHPSELHLKFIYPALSIGVSAIWLFQEARGSRTIHKAAQNAMRLGFMLFQAFWALYALFSARGLYTQLGVGERVDMLHSAAITCFCLAALLPRPDASPEPLAEHPPRIASFIPFLPAALALGYALLRHTLHQPFDAVLLLSGLIIGVTLCLRMYITQRDLERLSEHLESEVAARVVDLRRSQQEVIRGQRMRAISTLASGFAHDFKNQLQVIQNWSELLRMQLADRPAGLGEEWSRGLQAIRSASDQGGQLVQKILAAGRQQDLRPEFFDVRERLLHLTPSLQGVLGSCCELDLELGDGPVTAFMDPRQLDLVILNLTSNARDAMPSGGLVKIRATQDKHSVVIDIEDSGVGIPKVNMDHIFDPFFTTKSEGHGTGLGLSTVQGIIAQSRGQIRVKSEEGLGTTFTLLLPTK